MLEKSANCISTMGRIPFRAAPIAVPTIGSSLIGGFRTRPRNSFAKPFLAVTENALILAQQFRMRFADRFEVSDAHEKSAIRNPNFETISKSKCSKLLAVSFEFCISVIRICFGFRYSDFGFAAHSN